MVLARYRKALLAAGAGLAMALALPGPGLWQLVLLVPGLVLAALDGTGPWRAFRLGWLAGFVQWVVAVPWVVIVLHRYGHLPLVLALVGWLLMAAILALTWGLASAATVRVPVSWRGLVMPMSLVAMEVLQRFPPWIFLWDPAAAVVSGIPLLLWPLAVVSAPGLSLLIFLTGAALGEVVFKESRRRGVRRLAVFAACYVAASLASPGFQAAGPPLTAAALQPNVPLEVRWDAENLAEIQDRVWRLTEEAARDGARWIVWPESAIPRVIDSDTAYREGIEQLARNHDVWLLLGSIGLGERTGEYFNSVYAVSPAGVLPDRYDKIHLVPFGEYVPLAGRIAALRALVREVGSFTPGRSTKPIASPVGPVGVSVCYEVTFATLMADQVRQGATVLATITNDGWYGDSAAPRQHLALAVLRAAENRRYLVRAAVTGISTIIDPYGRPLTSLSFGAEGLVHAQVVPAAGVTPASRLAVPIHVVAVLLPLAAILLANLCRRRSGFPARREKVNRGAAC